MTAIGQYRHRVTLGNPGDPVPDGDGGYTETFTPLDPADWDCSIRLATQRDLERVAAGTVIAQATHLLNGRYHPQVTTETRVQFEGRTFHVTAVVNPDERDMELTLLCSEVVA